MKAGRCGVLVSAVLSALAGCAHIPSGAAPRPGVSAFAPCPCDNVANLPRGRLTPAPPPGLPGAPPGLVIQPGMNPPPGVLVQPGTNPPPAAVIQPGTNPPPGSDFRA